MQNPQEAPQEGVFINHHFRLKYCKLLKINIVKLSGEGIYKPPVQAEILQNYSIGGIYKPSRQAEILKHFQKVEFINHQ